MRIWNDEFEHNLGDAQISQYNIRYCGVLTVTKRVMMVVVYCVTMCERLGSLKIGGEILLYHSLVAKLLESLVKIATTKPKYT